MWNKARPFGGNTSLNEKLVAHWALDDDAPNKHYADSLGRIPGVLISPTHNTEDITVAGLQGNAIQLDGTDYINLPSAWDHISFDHDALLSVFCVMKRTWSASSGSYTLFSTRASGSSVGIHLYISVTDARLYLRIEDVSGNYLLMRWGNSLGYNTWTDVGFTYDGSGSLYGIKLYVNAVTNYYSPISSGSPNNCLTTIATIAKDLGTSGYLQPTCPVQQFSIWQKVLSQTDVAARYAGGTILPC